MRTRHLHQAYRETSKLVDFLVPREWYDSPELCGILERADNEIGKIVEKAISDVLAKLQGSYCEEAHSWAEGTMTTMGGKVIKTTARERQQASADLKRIKATTAKLYEIL